MHYNKNQPPSLQMLEPHQTSYRWVILALVWLLYLAHGFIGRSAAPLVTPMLKDLDMTYGQ
ncbi:MAG: hypothetical protein JRJ20_17845, partial [Deltaproteobacteria bacterium]|nr:hypothetical protein [Deltaproteobacteria bacterium]